MSFLCCWLFKKNSNAFNQFDILKINFHRDAQTSEDFIDSSLLCGGHFNITRNTQYIKISLVK